MWHRAQPRHSELGPPTPEMHAREIVQTLLAQARLDTFARVISVQG
jgi:hypothetical protein